MGHSGSSEQRVVSGIRATGELHLGHLHGIIKNWVRLQHEYECLFFVADWHALTTHYENPYNIAKNTREIVIDLLSCGVSPGSATLFVQSQVSEHAELHLLLSMITPIGWLERVPTYKDQQEKLKEKDLSNYGFLGYPVLQSADVLLYKAGFVPVGEDQVSHLELSREIARRFNHLYGREGDFEEKAKAAIQKMGKKAAKAYYKYQKQYQEEGDDKALELGKALLEEQANLALADRERLLGFLEGSGRIILQEPQALLSDIPKMPGLDGQKMSKSYDNTIKIREKPEVVAQKIKVMPTDPARVRRTDPGDPNKCPVWGLHKIYADDDTKNWVTEGCTTAKIGCLECKKVLSDAIIKEQEPILALAKEYTECPSLVDEIIREGCDNARALAQETLQEVRDVIGLYKS